MGSVRKGKRGCYLAWGGRRSGKAALREGYLHWVLKGKFGGQVGEY